MQKENRGAALPKEKRKKISHPGLKMTKKIARSIAG
jgi:hypothetical protein